VFEVAGQQRLLGLQMKKELANMMLVGIPDISRNQASRHPIE
jgi:hypothetical protein